MQNRRLGDDGGAEVAVQQRIDIVEELPPQRLVEAHLMAQLRQPLRRDAALAHAHLDGVAGHEPQHHESDEHERDECRNCQRQALEEEPDHVNP